jgi:hypothetical protein
MQRLDIQGVASFDLALACLREASYLSALMDWSSFGLDGPVDVGRTLEVEADLDQIRVFQ